MQIHAAMKKETTTENSKAKLRKKCMDFAIKMVFDYAYGLLNLREYECNHFSFLTESKFKGWRETTWIYIFMLKSMFLKKNSLIFSKRSSPKARRKWR